MLFSSEDPSLTLANTTHEDSDGGRESTIAFQGEQSGGEISTLAQIEAAHDGTADDQKGDLIFKTNDGSDGTSPTTAMVIDSKQNVGISAAPSSDWGGNAVLQMSHGSFSSSSSFGTGVSTNLAATNAGWSSKYLATGAASAYLQATSNGGHRFYTAPSGSAGASATITESVRIDSDGLKFNGDTAAANALSDYEEGTHTFTWNGGGTLSISQNNYVKIGNIVHLAFDISFPANSVGSGCNISIPFTATGSYYSGPVMYHTASGHLHAEVNGGIDKLLFRVDQTGGATCANLSSKRVIGFVTYVHG